MTAPTAQAVALVLLRDRGVYSLAPSTEQACVVRPADIADVALNMTAALQEAADLSGGEQLRQPGSGFVQAPASVTVDVTQGSSTMANFTTWAAWMEQCTIRFAGDPMDNVLLSATKLARPYAGVTAAGTSATVWCDAFVQDDTVEKIVGDMILANNSVCVEVKTAMEFIQRGAFPTQNRWQPGNGGYFPGYSFAPFWSLGPKPNATAPLVYFLDTYRDLTKDYVTRIVRLSPMPTAIQAIGWTVKLNPIRITAADIVSGLTTIVVTGATSDTNINQTYTYVCDVNGYRAFCGVTHTAYTIFFHLALNKYIIAATASLSVTPGAYWLSALGSSPLGTFTATGTATGNATAATTDTGAGAADPGTKIQMPNGYVESIILPIARQIGSGAPTFHNTEIKPEVDRQYVAAKARLTSSVASASSRSPTRYL